MNDATRKMWSQMIHRCGFRFCHTVAYGASDPVEMRLMRDNRVVAYFTLRGLPDEGFDKLVRRAVVAELRARPPQTSRTY